MTLALGGHKNSCHTAPASGFIYRGFEQMYKGKWQLPVTSTIGELFMIKKRFFKTKDEVEVTFEYAETKGVDSVSLVSEHNNWQPVDMPQLKRGAFQVKERLPKNGRFQFRYLVNGEGWVNDEAADDYVANEHGSQNGVVDTHAA
jgi:hypothetical protein